MKENLYVETHSFNIFKQKLIQMKNVLIKYKTSLEITAFISVSVIGIMFGEALSNQIICNMHTTYL